MPKSSTHDDLAKAWPLPTADQLIEVADRLDAIVKAISKKSGKLSERSARLMREFLAHDHNALTRWYTRCVRLNENVALKEDLTETFSVIGRLLGNWYGEETNDGDKKKHLSDRPAYPADLQDLEDFVSNFYDRAAELGAEKSATGLGRIDFPNPSVPMTKATAAAKWGGDMSADKLTTLMDNRMVRYHQLNRQSFIFCCDDVPNLKPSHTTRR